MAVATGAYGNIGDAVIRRRALSWVAGIGRLHVYVGNADEQWIDQLQLPTDARVYPAGARKEWFKLALRRRRVDALLLDPGAVPLSKHALPIELTFLLLGLLVRLRGGVVVRPPRGVGGTHPLTLLVHRLAVRSSHVTLWRNEKSMQIVKAGERCPDTAFQEEHLWDSADDAARDALVVSMRGKRDFPSAAWVTAVRRLASDLDLRIVCVAQVREDENRAAEIAKTLGAEHLVWGDATDLAHEARLRELYTRTRLVVSDRLHVTILAAVAGAYPFEVADSPSDKVSTHFAQIGVTDISFDSDAPVEEIVAAARRGISEIDALRTALGTASSELDAIESRVRALVSRKPQR